MDKHERKALLKRWKHAEQAERIAGMPITPVQLHQLLDYLDNNLGSCDHTTRLTATYLAKENWDGAKVLKWLAEQGGYCDCEVLANVVGLDDSPQNQSQRPTGERASKQNRVARDLQTPTGWNLSNLPVPWRVSNLYAPSEPIQLTLGKKDGCAITIVKSTLSRGDQAIDEYWSRLWYARTKLPARGELQVTRGALELPDGFQSTLVRSPSWTPVYCWIVPLFGRWHLEVRSELNRYAGDLRQISALITRLAAVQP
jgi:Protein of unknown function (DUF2695)